MTKRGIVTLSLLAAVVVASQSFAWGAGGREPLRLRKDLKVEDLGAPVATMRAAPFVVRSRQTGDLHLFACLMALNRIDYVKDPPMELYHLNLNTGEARLARCAVTARLYTIRTALPIRSR